MLLQFWQGEELIEIPVCDCVCYPRMMEVEVGHHSVLLTRCEGKYSAIGNQCTHYGAPLSKGTSGWMHLYSIVLHFYFDT